MIGLALTFGLAITPPMPAAGNGIAVAQRLMAAIKGSAEFRQSDFARPMEARDQVALRHFAPCRVANIGYMLQADATERDTYVQNRNEVMVRLGCKGVSQETPVGLTIHLQNGKIVTVETHNADLMRAN